MKRNWNGMLVDFAESVYAKLPLKKPATVKKGKKTKRKMVERSIHAIWLGIYPRTGEHIVMKENGDAVRVRTVNRRPEGHRFEPEAITGMEASPRTPTPSSRRRTSDVDAEPGLDGSDREQCPRDGGGRPGASGGTASRLRAT